MPRPLSQLSVFQCPGRDRSLALLEAGSVVIRCRIGPGGIAARKQEGDGATPSGRFRLVRARLRRDRGFAPALALAWKTARPDDGWCDDALSFQYNRPVRLPARCRHERLWRDDTVYDVVIELDHNTRPRRLGAGSAIFFHLTENQPGPTAGCIAISPAAMRRLLPRLSAKCRINIQRS